MNRTDYAYRVTFYAYMGIFALLLYLAVYG